MSKSLSAVEQARLAIFTAMTPDTQAVARELETTYSKVAMGFAISQYDVGARIVEVVDDESRFGQASISVKQLAQYLNVHGGPGTLYGLANVARMFDREFVKTTSAKPMANGNFMSVGHWVCLTRLEDPKGRKALVSRILAEGLSVGDLEKEIQSGAAGSRKNARAGGRNPVRPTSVMVGLQKTYQIANTWVRWQKVAVEDVAAGLDTIPPDKVDDAIIAKTRETIALVTKAEEAAAAVRSQLEAGLAHLEEVVDGRKDAAAKPPEYDEGEATPAATAGPAKKPGLKKKGKKKVKKKGKATAV